MINPVKSFNNSNRCHPLKIKVIYLFLSLTFVLKCISNSILIRFKPGRDNLIQIVN